MSHLPPPQVPPPVPQAAPSATHIPRRLQQPPLAQVPPKQQRRPAVPQAAQVFEPVSHVSMGSVQKRAPERPGQQAWPAPPQPEHLPPPQVPYMVVATVHIDASPTHVPPMQHAPPMQGAPEPQQG